VTFVTMALLLVVVFAVITISVREQVRQSVSQSLESSQRMFAALETRRQRDQRTVASALAENPTLKAALDTYVAETRFGKPETLDQLVATIEQELDKLATLVESDAIVLVDARQNTIAAAGQLRDRWPHGRFIAPAGAGDASGFDGILRMNDLTFRAVAVPLVVTGTPIGTLYLATALDHRFALALANLSQTRIAIASDGVLLATTLPDRIAREFEAAVARSGAAEGTQELGGESYAFRRLVQIGPTSFYALGSIDESARTATRRAMRSLALVAALAALLALVGSVCLAHLFSRPIGQLSRSLETLASSHDVSGRLPLTGSSRELDALTETFNALMASVEAAEAQTEAAYTGAIRALATALDARDPYTAGHSDRVSVLSVAMGRALGLDGDTIEIIRLGALLHDIGKIGVPDDVLRKPGPLTPAEYDAIKQHPVLGARILRSVPFLAKHLPIVELHHERPDGRGYPYGLRGDDIPLAARVVHVADAYDAMTSARAYRGAMAAGDALRELWRCSGTEFHADIVPALVTALPALVADDGAPVLETMNG
jgi:putative nucleotidyltransferase with HDIG domain